MNTGNNQQSNGGGNGKEDVVPENTRSDTETVPVESIYKSPIETTTDTDLDASAPRLSTSASRRMSLRAGTWIGGIVMVLLGASLAMTNIMNGAKEKKVKVRDETVDVPSMPLSDSLSDSQPASTTTTKTTTTADTRTSASRMPESTSLVTLGPAKPRDQAVQASETAPYGPSLLERRMMTRDGAAPSAAPDPYAQALSAFQSPTQASPDNNRTGVAEAARASMAQPVNNPNTLMLRGTFIRCVLQTRIVTDIPGFTSCVVNEPVYSFNGRRLLLPKGSKVLGKYSMEPTGPRVAVIWDRVVTPNGIDVDMASPGVDNLGGAGHPGHYNAHWGSRIGSALLISMLSDAFKYEGAKHGPAQTSISNGVITQSPFESNTAATLQNLANQAVQQSANRPDTVTINQGTVVSIYVAKDVDFSGVIARF